MSMDIYPCLTYNLILDAMLRKKIFDIIEVAKDDSKLSILYDRFMMVVIIVSLVPLFFKESHFLLTLIEVVTVIIFVIDYILRWITADFHDKNPKGILSFIKYPFTAWAIIDILAILPSLTMLNGSFRIFKLFRLWGALKALKILRYSKSFSLILSVIKREKKPLLAVCNLTIGYIILSALIMFSAEPDSFNTFFDAFYWAVITLTTVGYGDIYPTGTVGRIVCMVSAFMGIAIVALPTGIITAGYTSALAEGKIARDSEEDTEDDSEEDAENDCENTPENDCMDTPEDNSEKDIPNEAEPPSLNLH